MAHETIRKKHTDQMTVKPNLLDVEQVRKNFDWVDVYDQLDWLPEGHLNKAHECIDRHCAEGKGDKVAFIWEGKNGEQESYTFSEFRDQSNKFANVLE